jgi:hypothetical protein
VNGIAYTATTQTRAELGKINTHCMGCHDDDSATAMPFGDGKTPITYAWDGSSVAKRYTQAGTATWGKYPATANAAQKNITKAYSAHGNAANNARGWSATTGVDGAITNSSGNVQVLCFDCHNSHGSAAGSVTELTTSYPAGSGTVTGGILKTTTNGLGGYSVTYTPTAGGSVATKNKFNPGAALCFDCHQNPNANTYGPWGYNTTFGATQPIISYWEKNSQWYGAAGINNSGPQVRYTYKNTRATVGTHFGASSALTHANAPTQMGTIKGLCTPCHDPHGITDNTTKIPAADKVYALPLLKGTWMTSPYKEDAAPLATNQKRGGSSSGPATYAKASTPGYYIDQNTFETITTSSATTGDWVWPGTNKITQTASQFGGLCLQCHAQADINPNSASPGTWQTMDRIHNTVKGWATAGSGANVNNAIHAFSCSKCHTPHSACLPRLMISNCLDVKHRGQAQSGGVSGGTSQSGSRGAGQGRFPGGGGGNVASNASDRFTVPNGGIGAWFAGNGGSTAGKSTPALNQCHNVANAGGTTHPASQIWNAKTPW